MVRVRRKGREGGRFLLVSTALSQPDLDEIDKIFEEYDTSMAKNVLPGDLFPILDATAILWRLQVRGEREDYSSYSTCSLLLLLGVWY